MTRALLLCLLAAAAHAASKCGDCTDLVEDGQCVANCECMQRAYFEKCSHRCKAGASLPDGTLPPTTPGPSLGGSDGTSPPPETPTTPGPSLGGSDGTSPPPETPPPTTNLVTGEKGKVNEHCIFRANDENGDVAPPIECLATITGNPHLCTTGIKDACSCTCAAYTAAQTHAPTDAPTTAARIVPFTYGFGRVWACEGDKLDITWDGGHSITETESASCTSKVLGEPFQEHVEKPHSQLYELGAKRGKTRYFKCDKHCSENSSRFEVWCPADNDKALEELAGHIGIEANECSDVEKSLCNHTKLGAGIRVLCPERCGPASLNGRADPGKDNDKAMTDLDTSCNDVGPCDLLAKALCPETCSKWEDDNHGTPSLDPDENHRRSCDTKKTCAHPREARKNCCALKDTVGCCNSNSDPELLDVSLPGRAAQWTKDMQDHHHRRINELVEYPAYVQILWPEVDAQHTHTTHARRLLSERFDLQMVLVDGSPSMSRTQLVQNVSNTVVDFGKGTVCVPTALHPCGSTGSCYNSGTHMVTCGVARDLPGSCVGDFYSRGYVNSRGCCHCQDGCDRSKETGSDCTYNDEAPTVAPTAQPTYEPTEVPTAQPTYEPTEVPTAAPTLPSYVTIEQRRSCISELTGAECKAIANDPQTGLSIDGTSGFSINTEDEGVSACVLQEVYSGGRKAKPRKRMEYFPKNSAKRVCPEWGESRCLCASGPLPTDAPTGEPTTHAPTDAPTYEPTDAPTAEPTSTVAPTAEPALRMKALRIQNREIEVGGKTYFGRMELYPTSVPDDPTKPGDRSDLLKPELDRVEFSRGARCVGTCSNETVMSADEFHEMAAAWRDGGSPPRKIELSGQGSATFMFNQDVDVSYLQWWVTQVEGFQAQRLSRENLKTPVNSSVDAFFTQDYTSWTRIQVCYSENEGIADAPDQLVCNGGITGDLALNTTDGLGVHGGGKCYGGPASHGWGSFCGASCGCSLPFVKDGHPPIINGGRRLYYIKRYQEEYIRKHGKNYTEAPTDAPTAVPTYVPTQSPTAVPLTKPFSKLKLVSTSKVKMHLPSRLAMSRLQADPAPLSDSTRPDLIHSQNLFREIKVKSVTLEGSDKHAGCKCDNCTASLKLMTQDHVWSEDDINGPVEYHTTDWGPVGGISCTSQADVERKDNDHTKNSYLPKCVREKAYHATSSYEAHYVQKNGRTWRFEGGADAVKMDGGSRCIPSGDYWGEHCAEEGWILKALIPANADHGARIEIEKDGVRRTAPNPWRRWDKEFSCIEMAPYAKLEIEFESEVRLQHALYTRFGEFQEKSTKVEDYALDLEVHTGKEAKVCSEYNGYRADGRPYSVDDCPTPQCKRTGEVCSDNEMFSNGWLRWPMGEIAKYPEAPCTTKDSSCKALRWTAEPKMLRVTNNEQFVVHGMTHDGRVGRDTFRYTTSPGKPTDYPTLTTNTTRCKFRPSGRDKGDRQGCAEDVAESWTSGLPEPGNPLTCKPRTCNPDDPATCNPLHGAHPKKLTFSCEPACTGSKNCAKQATATHTVFRDAPLQNVKTIDTWEQLREAKKIVGWMTYLSLGRGLNNAERRKDANAMHEAYLTYTPTPTPTRSPTRSPTSSPTHSPTRSPTRSPTHSPTRYPTAAPTQRKFMMQTLRIHVPRPQGRFVREADGQSKGYHGFSFGKLQLFQTEACALRNDGNSSECQYKVSSLDDVTKKPDMSSANMSVTWDELLYGDDFGRVKIGSLGPCEFSTHELCHTRSQVQPKPWFDESNWRDSKLDSECYNNTGYPLHHKQECQEKLRNHALSAYAVPDCGVELDPRKVLDQTSYAFNDGCFFNTRRSYHRNVGSSNDVYWQDSRELKIDFGTNLWFDDGKFYLRMSDLGHTTKKEGRPTEKPSPDMVKFEVWMGYGDTFEKDKDGNDVYVCHSANHDGGLFQTEEACTAAKHTWGRKTVASLEIPITCKQRAYTQVKGTRTPGTNCETYFVSTADYNNTQWIATDWLEVEPRNLFTRGSGPTDVSPVTCPTGMGSGTCLVAKHKGMVFLMENKTGVNKAEGCRISQIAHAHTDNYAEWIDFWKGPAVDVFEPGNGGVYECSQSYRYVAEESSWVQYSDTDSRPTEEPTPLPTYAPTRVPTPSPTLHPTTTREIEVSALMIDFTAKESRNVTLTQLEMYDGTQSADARDVGTDCNDGAAPCRPSIKSSKADFKTNHGHLETQCVNCGGLACMSDPSGSLKDMPEYASCRKYVVKMGGGLLGDASTDARGISRVCEAMPCKDAMVDFQASASEGVKIAINPTDEYWKPENQATRRSRVVLPLNSMLRLDGGVDGHPAFYLRMSDLWVSADTTDLDFQVSVSRGGDDWAQATCVPIEADGSRARVFTEDEPKLPIARVGGTSRSSWEKGKQELKFTEVVIHCATELPDSLGFKSGETEPMAEPYWFYPGGSETRPCGMYKRVCDGCTSATATWIRIPDVTQENIFGRDDTDLPPVYKKDSPLDAPESCYKGSRYQYCKKCCNRYTALSYSKKLYTYMKDIITDQTTRESLFGAGTGATLDARIAPINLTNPNIPYNKLENLASIYGVQLEAITKFRPHSERHKAHDIRFRIIGHDDGTISAYTHGRGSNPMTGSSGYVNPLRNKFERRVVTGRVRHQTAAPVEFHGPSGPGHGVINATLNNYFILGFGPLAQAYYGAFNDPNNQGDRWKDAAGGVYRCELKDKDPHVKNDASPEYKPEYKPREEEPQYGTGLPTPVPTPSPTPSPTTLKCMLDLNAFEEANYNLPASVEYYRATQVENAADGLETLWDYNTLVTGPLDEYHSAFTHTSWPMTPVSQFNSATMKHLNESECKNWADTHDTGDWQLLSYGRPDYAEGCVHWNGDAFFWNRYQQAQPDTGSKGSGKGMVIVKSLTKLTGPARVFLLEGLSLTCKHHSGTANITECSEHGGEYIINGCNGTAAPTYEPTEVPTTPTPTTPTPTTGAPTHEPSGVWNENEQKWDVWNPYLEYYKNNEAAFKEAERTNQYWVGDNEIACEMLSYSNNISDENAWIRTPDEWKTVQDCAGQCLVMWEPNVYYRRGTRSDDDTKNGGHFPMATTYNTANKDSVPQSYGSCPRERWNRDLDTPMPNPDGTSTFKSPLWGKQYGFLHGAALRMRGSYATTQSAASCTTDCNTNTDSAECMLRPPKLNRRLTCVKPYTDSNQIQGTECIINYQQWRHETGPYKQENGPAYPEAGRQGYRHRAASNIRSVKCRPDNFYGEFVWEEPVTERKIRFPKIAPGQMKGVVRPTSGDNKQLQIAEGSQTALQTARAYQNAPRIDNLVVLNSAQHNQDYSGLALSITTARLPLHKSPSPSAPPTTATPTVPPTRVPTLSPTMVPTDLPKCLVRPTPGYYGSTATGPISASETDVTCVHSTGAKGNGTCAGEGLDMTLSGCDAIPGYYDYDPNTRFHGSGFWLPAAPMIGFEGEQPTLAELVTICNDITDCVGLYLDRDDLNQTTYGLAPGADMTTVTLSETDGEVGRHAALVGNFNGYPYEYSVRSINDWNVQPSNSVWAGDVCTTTRISSEMGQPAFANWRGPQCGAETDCFDPCNVARRFANERPNMNKPVTKFYWQRGDKKSATHPESWRRSLTSSKKNIGIFVKNNFQGRVQSWEDGIPKREAHPTWAPTPVPATPSPTAPHTETPFVFHDNACTINLASPHVTTHGRSRLEAASILSPPLAVLTVDTFGGGTALIHDKQSNCHRTDLGERNPPCGWEGTRYRWLTEPECQAYAASEKLTYGGSGDKTMSGEWVELPGFNRQNHNNWGQYGCYRHNDGKVYFNSKEWTAAQLEKSAWYGRNVNAWRYVTRQEPGKNVFSDTCGGIGLYCSNDPSSYGTTCGCIVQRAGGSPIKKATLTPTQLWELQNAAAAAGESVISYGGPPHTPPRPDHVLSAISCPTAGGEFQFGFGPATPAPSRPPTCEKDKIDDAGSEFAKVLLNGNPIWNPSDSYRNKLFKHSACYMASDGAFSMVGDVITVAGWKLCSEAPTNSGYCHTNGYTAPQGTACEYITRICAQYCSTTSKTTLQDDNVLACV